MKTPTKFASWAACAVSLTLASMAAPNSSTPTAGSQPHGYTGTGSSYGNNNMDTRAGMNMPLSSDDRDFIKKAAKSGMKEVTVSRSVMPNLANGQVRDFAQTVIDDHKEANADLRELASKKGVALPSEDGDLVEDWANNNHGADEDYVDEMVDDHQSAVKLFEKASASTDSDVASFAQEYLPKLREHLNKAKSLKETL